MRLNGYDYSSDGYYFITIVTGDRIPFFGSIDPNNINLSEAGIVANDELLKTEDLRDNVFIDEYLIMPDHVHFIMIISSCSLVAQYEATGGAGYEGSEPDYFSLISPKPGTVSAIVRSYKSAVTKRCREAGIAEFSWQSGFYDRIIRKQHELDAIRKYIRENPEKWRFINSS